MTFCNKSLDFIGFYIFGGLKKCIAANSSTFYITGVSMSSGISSSVDESSKIFDINLHIFLNRISIVNFYKSLVIRVISDELLFSTIF